MATIQILATLGHKGEVTSVAFSPDGQRIVTASRDGTARLWDATKGRALAVLVGHKGTVTSAAFSPDGQQVATASSDGTARLWDATKGKGLAVLRGTPKPVTSAAFSPDGQRVITAGCGDKTDLTSGRCLEGTARIYLVHTADLVKLAQTRVTRGLTCAERVQYLQEDIVCPTPTPAATSTP